jgi:hypothetical protein
MQIQRDVNIYKNNNSWTKTILDMIGMAKPYYVDIHFLDAGHLAI